MVNRHIKWAPVFGVYFAVAAGSLAVGALAGPPMHGVLMVAGVILVAGFVPLVMGIYFWRGLRGNV